MLLSSLSRMENIYCAWDYFVRGGGGGKGCGEVFHFYNASSKFFGGKEGEWGNEWCGKMYEVRREAIYSRKGASNGEKKKEKKGH